MKITNHRLDCPQIESPNQSGIISPTLLVLHYTASGSSKNADAKYFKSPAAKASAHLVIERDGSIVQCVAFNKKAWHAGKSIWRGRANCNDYSIGIEIDNWGILTKRANGNFYSYTGEKVPSDRVLSAPNKRGNSGHWETYTSEQLDAVEMVVDLILKTYPSITEIVGHEDVAPGRKVDPGPALYDFMRELNNKFADGRRNDTTSSDFRKVTAASLRVRATASIGAKVVGSLRRGETVEVLYDAGDWAQIKFPPGWVYDRYLK